MKFNVFKLLATIPNATFIECNEGLITNEQAIERIEAAVKTLSALNANTIAIFADNQADWVFVDLACQQLNLCCIPLPLFFSDKQIQHAISEANIDCIITDQSHRLNSFNDLVDESDKKINQLSIYDVTKNFDSRKPRNTQKITFTSGSTGAPKGVCLTFEQQWTVAQSLADTVNKKNVRHLCLLPLSTLLENLAGIYAPTLVGGTIILSPIRDLGFNGSADFQLEKLLHTLKRVQPNSLILLPQLLLALVTAAEAGWQAPDSLSFIAVGGGKVAKHLIERAHKYHLPVFEGYGLSECASVVSLNEPHHALDRPGSTGKPLPHAKVKIIEDEIIVSGTVFLGYLNQADSWYPGEIHTGDLGHFDDDGYLYIDGRIKNILVSSFGRNINPEWVESELASHPIIHQCVVIGDARPFCTALIFPRDMQLTNNEEDALIQQWVDKINQSLPDYAQVQRWLKLDKPLSPSDDLLTDNGRPKRKQINDYYQTEIQQIYQATREKQT